MGRKEPCCPNCETVMILRYEPTEVEGSWYECPICGHRMDNEEFRTFRDEQRKKFGRW